MIELTEINDTKYYIDSDYNQWKVGTISEWETDDGEKKRKLRPKWYFSILSNAFKKLYELEMRNYDYKSIDQVLQRTKKVKDWIQENLQNVEELEFNNKIVVS